MATPAMDDLAAHALELVNRELQSTLDAARAQLEDYVDGRAGPDALARTAEYLHAARGALKIVEIHGAALLAEEMEQTCRRLAEGKEEDKVEQGIEALTRAMVQLPAYLERLLGGGKDVALALLPLLNDLRQARDKPSLSEGTLVLLNAGPFERHLEPRAPGPAGAEVGRGFDKLAHRFRQPFQAALLGWIKGAESARHLDELLRVSTNLERAAASEQVKQLWTVMTAVLVAIRGGGLEASVTLKRLIGQADRQLKRLADGGESALINAPPVELLNSLLYYVARANSTDPRIESLRNKYNLSEMLPGDLQVEQAREGLSGPSVKLMRTVAQAIKEDLGQVKDALDIFVRTGMQSVDKLGAQLEMLKKIGDTLGVLGLERARGQIQRETQELATIVMNGKVLDQTALEKIAATLLDVEDTLDRELVRAVLPTDDAEPADAATEGDAQQRQVTQAVMGECAVNLAKVKEAVIALVDNPADLRPLEQAKPQLRGIAAGLLMLGKPKAVAVIERVGTVVGTRLAAGTKLRPEYLERLADAIVSVEYYMETVSAGRSDPWYMLENAERCLDLLEKLPVAKSVAPQPAAAPVPPKPAPKPAASAPIVMQVEEGRSDPELVEVFIEEAKEEIANIARNLPLWTGDRENSEALIATRRSFHTLKGSGRMVGAQLLGEFAWNIENLLNRVINQTLEPTLPMVAFVEEACAALPQLLEQLEVGLNPKVDVQLLMKRAEAFAEGDPDAASITSQSLRVQAQPAAAAEPAMDPVLADIFVKELRGHLKVIRDFLAASPRETAPHTVGEPLYRACHTLLGSARMAGFEPVMALAAPLSEQLRRHFESDVGLGVPELGALRAAADQIEAMAEGLTAGRIVQPDPAVRKVLEGLKARLQPSAASPSEAAPPAVPAAAAPVAPAPAAPAPAGPTPAAAVPEQGAFDPEIAAIFAEEAAEILDGSQAALQDVRQRQEQSSVAMLQRNLHTLKGGARMAGVMPMGDLSHALETLLARIAEGRSRPTQGALDLVQRGLDALQQMRDAIDSGRGIPPAAALIAQLEGFEAPVVASAAVSAPVAPAVDAPVVAATAAVQPAVEVPQAVAAPTQPAEMPAIDLTEADLRRLEEIELEVPPQAVIEDVRAAAEVIEDPTVEEPAAHEEALVAHEQTIIEPPGIVIELPDVIEEPRPVESAASPQPAAAPPVVEARAAERAEIARVDASLLDVLLNGAGEINIFQSRLSQQLHSIEFHLGELGGTVSRLREQLRKLEAETEAQILHRHQDDADVQSGFDPLELDRYSTIQQLSRALAESANDVASINELLNGLTGEADTLLTQQARVTSELQNGLMQTRMVPFNRQVPRLQRIVRQACADTGKQAELLIEGEASEIDRQVLESMLPPFEHLLRNAVAHGIESPAVRRKRGKPEIGKVLLKIRREGSEVITEVSDDGGGLDLAAIRRKAFEKGFVAENQKITDEQAVELILQPGFSTASELTQAAGRGVGMDVVDNEIKKLGGSLRIETTPGQGTRFVIRLPYTLAITHALIVNVGDETFALPLPTVEGITRLSRDKILKYLTQDEPRLDYGGVVYRIQHLGSLVGAAPSALPEDENAVSLVLIRAGDNSTALLMDSLEGSREIVVKTLGPHIASVPGVTGATILGDGRVIMILDPGTLVRAHRPTEAPPTAAPQPVAATHLTALVVDDSITMRRVTQRLLERRGAKVHTARDGLDAITVLQEHAVDIILLDIEMPRMDGYQFATHVRNDAKLKNLPIIMITSRSGEKHRAKAIEIGVNDYLSKPYQESQLIAAISALLGREL